MRSSNDVKSPPASSCDILRELLKRRPDTRLQNSGPSFTTGGQIVLPSSSPTVAYDRDTNTLLRLQLACQNDMLLSPHSKGEAVFVDRHDYDAQSERPRSNIRNK